MTTYLHESRDGRLVEYRRHPYDPQHLARQHGLGHRKGPGDIDPDRDNRRLDRWAAELDAFTARHGLSIAEELFYDPDTGRCTQNQLARG